MTTSEQIYSEWRSSLKSPDDSLFYYHPDLERILLGLSIYAISSGPLVKDLGKAESLRILNIYITDLITAWIDEDDDSFKTMFDLTMTVAEAYIPCLMAAEREYHCRAVHAPHIRRTQELSLLRQREDGRHRLRLSNTDLHMPTDEGVGDRVLPESIPQDSGRIRQSDQSSPHEHGSLR